MSQVRAAAVSQGGKMATAAGIFSHQMTAGQALTRNVATPMGSATSGTSGASSSGGSSDSSATISANDFLTLLVTEMQNQDPTSDTDPNEYIDQLVQVNSLEQLIDINQTLSADAGSASSTSGTGASTQAVGAASSPTNSTSLALAAASPQAAAHLAGSPLSTAPGVAASNASAPQTTSTQRISGNLSAPDASPAARRVGHALAGRTLATSVQGTSPSTP
jgi:flagellar basal-body rod modification protein FlgD